MERPRIASLILSLAALLHQDCLHRVQAFSTVSIQQQQPPQLRPHTFFFSSPSDSGESDEDSAFREYGYGVTDVVADDTTTPTEDLVNKVLDHLPTNFDGGVSSETQSAMNELLFQLEPLNPTHDPAKSSMMNGVWELRYAGGYADDVSVLC